MSRGRLVVAAVLVLVAGQAVAGTWSRVIGDSLGSDGGNSVWLGDGSLVVSGREATPLTGSIVTRLDGMGRTMGSVVIDDFRAYGICPTSTGGAIIVGWGAERATVVRLDSTGRVESMRTHGDELSSAVACATLRDGGHALSIQVSAAPGTQECGILRLDADGNPLWAQVYDTGFMNHWGLIAELAGGDLVFPLGYHDLARPNADAMIVVTTATGDPRWVTRFGADPSTDTPRFVAPLPVGGFLAGFGDFYPCIVGFASDGTVTSSKVWSSGNRPGMNSPITLADGRILVALTCSGPTPGVAHGLAELDAAGNVIWQRAFDAASRAGSGAWLSLEPSGDVVVGVTQSVGSGRALAVHRVSSIGDTDEPCPPLFDPVLTFVDTPAPVGPGSVTRRSPDMTPSTVYRASASSRLPSPHHAPRASRPRKSRGRGPLHPSASSRSRTWPGSPPQRATPTRSSSSAAHCPRCAEAPGATASSRDCSPRQRRIPPTHRRAAPGSTSWRAAIRPATVPSAGHRPATPARRQRPAREGASATLAGAGITPLTVRQQRTIFIVHRPRAYIGGARHEQGQEARTGDQGALGRGTHASPTLVR